MSGADRPIPGLWCFRALLLAFPREFRRRFEPEMVAMFEARSSAAGPSPLARIALWRALVADVVRSAARERWPDRASLSLQELRYDARQAWRSVSRAPLPAVFVVVLMALAIGSTISVFSIVHAVLLRPFPFADPDRLVMIWERRGPENTRNIVGAHEYPEWQSASRSFAHMAAIAFDRDYNLTGAGEPMKLVAARVTGDFFPVMGVSPIVGRPVTADDDRPGHGTVVVISETLWRSRFAADPGIAGRSVQVNGTPYTIVGVMPAAFTFPDGPGGAAPDIWTPIAEPIRLYRGRHYLSVVARLNPGVTIAQAQAELDGISARISREQPQFSGGHGVNVQPLHAEIVQGYRRAVLVVFAAVALVLLIGCCNVANLLLARAAARQQEMAVRLALGASRLRVARQLLAEGGLLAVLGGGTGLVVAAWLIALARTRVAADLPRVRDAALDPVVVLFALGVTMITALLFGLVPLGQALRVEVADRLRHGAKGIARHGRQPLRKAIVIAEVALTMIVATGAGLFLQSLHNLARVIPGFTTQDVMAMEIALPASRYATPPQQRAFFDDAVARLAALPDVVSVAATNFVPHGPGRSGVGIAIEGRPQANAGDQASANYRIVSTDYFRTLSIPVVAGRVFNQGDIRLAVPLIRWFPQQPLPPGFDAPQPPPVAVINETMARRFWPGESPLGKRFKDSVPQGANDDWITVVGLVKDTRHFGLERDPVAQWFQPQRQSGRATTVMVIRTRVAPESVVPDVRAALHSLDKEIRIARIGTLDQQISGQTSPRRMRTAIMVGFSLFALLLSMLGIYGLLQYAVSRRTSEIGVRVALGAPRGAIAGLVLGQALRLVVAGVVFGFLAAVAVVRLMASQLFGVGPMDVPTLTTVPLVLCAVSLAACVRPLRRAMNVSPIVALRGE